ncbi:MAG: Zn-dependent alcohol dehydrogenase [Dehalococcoidia bacterium]
MKAMIYHGPHQTLTLENIDIDKPGPHEVIVKTAATGVCHSDLHFVDGLYPYPAPAILGHEAAGVVTEVGSLVNYVKPGDHVICCLSVFCGTCNFCLSGRPNLCQDPSRARGPQEKPKYSWNGSPVFQFLNISSYAEYMNVHENAVVKIREDMPLDKAALIGCGVMTGTGAVLNTARVPAGSTVAIFGCGGVGLSAVQGARIAGAGMVIAVDMVESKLATARTMGATHVVDASSGDPVAKIREITGGGVEFSFEAIGNKRAAEQAFESLQVGGTATIIGMIPVGQKVELDGTSFLFEKKVQGSSMGSNVFRRDMPRYVDFYMRGLLDLDGMITKTGRLEDVNEAFRAMKAGEVARTVLIP